MIPPAFRSLVAAPAGLFAGLMLATLALPVAARAEAPPAAAPAWPSDVPEPGKTISVIVYGDDPCPQGKGDEIVVCARQPESERYRIPKRFRGKKAESSPANNSWANKVRTTEDSSRTAAGIPNTCSAVGTGGQSGCQQQFLTRAMQARQQQKEDDSGVP